MGKIANTIVACAALLMSASVAKAQEKVELTLSADFVSQYVWRGQELGQVSVQPTLGVAYKGLSFSAWGTLGLSRWSDPKEVDLTLAYTIAGFNVGITDYWNDSNAKYFDYKSGSTSHVFEANVGYDFGFLSLQWYTNFAGNDGLNKSGKRAYSSYFEASVPFRIVGVDFAGTVGVVPYATDFYNDANGFAVTNVSLKAMKAIPFTKKFSLPLFAGLHANPSTQKLFFVVGLTLGI